MSWKRPDSVGGDGRRGSPFNHPSRKCPEEVSLVKPQACQRRRTVFIVSLALSRADEVHWAKIKPLLFHPWPVLTLLGAAQKHAHAFRPDSGAEKPNLFSLGRPTTKSPDAYHNSKFSHRQSDVSSYFTEDSVELKAHIIYFHRIVVVYSQMRIRAQVEQIPNILPQTNTFHQQASATSCERLLMLPQSEFSFGSRHEEVMLGHLWGRHTGWSWI